ncbi:MAG: hypothetical protein G01um101448_1069 [Parcubacteria group bacterium Gr01-1014_48]|nr:MAG: hypothetical protein Greene041614_882 [Parcubacteria group bacterium Greene0416_14]TSC71924.1 MAG: hypothetical protein G01um101448_1069 [Parcubacteria group bacterium Gr01-1014_48]TSD01095.1 MAG: hypothetical protein Greene101415_498 [Parcubacteria group bacterium Greene1014_15]TSD07965.1 MAG: hypothetical protein Greene07144_546 [Parcubacteria group bacterium Greene0714_4]
MNILLETLKKYKVLGVVFVISLLFGVYALFFRSETPSEDILITTSPESSEVDAVSVDLIALLLSLKTIDIDTTLFSDDRFKSLTDFSVELVRQEVGRPNPFLPIGR